MLNNLRILTGVGLFAVLLSLISSLKTDMLWPFKDPIGFCLILLVRVIHWSIFLFNSFYVFLFDKEWDWIFLGLLLAVSIHWVWFKCECIVTYFEKKILDKEYSLGDRPFNHPFAMDTSFHPEYGSRAFFDAMFSLTFVSLVLVLWRIDVSWMFKLTYILIIIVVRFYIEAMRKNECMRLD